MRCIYGDIVMRDYVECPQMVSDDETTKPILVKKNENSYNNNYKGKKIIVSIQIRIIISTVL